MKLSKLKSAGMRTSVAGILTVGAFEVEHDERDRFGKLGVKSVRLVGKFSQCSGTV